MVLYLTFTLQPNVQLVKDSSERRNCRIYTLLKKKMTGGLELDDHEACLKIAADKLKFLFFNH